MQVQNSFQPNLPRKIDSLKAGGDALNSLMKELVFKEWIDNPHTFELKELQSDSSYRVLNAGLNEMT